VARDQIAVELVTGLDDPLEVRRHARVDARDRAHPEHARDALGGARMLRLHVDPVPLVADRARSAEPGERVV
jgi:hypothetical protein